MVHGLKYLWLRDYEMGIIIAQNSEVVYILSHKICKFFLIEFLSNTQVHMKVTSLSADLMIMKQVFKYNIITNILPPC